MSVPVAGKLVLMAIGGWIGVALLDVVLIFVVAVMAGPGIASGERAAVVALSLLALIGLGATAGFWWKAGALAAVPRALATFGVLVVHAGIFAALGLFTLVALNR